MSNLTRKAISAVSIDDMLQSWYFSRLEPELPVIYHDHRQIED